VSIWKCRG